MKRQVDYTWRLAELMAARGMHNSTDLIPLPRRTWDPAVAPAGLSRGSSTPRTGFATDDGRTVRHLRLRSRGPGHRHRKRRPAQAKPRPPQRRRLRPTSSNSTSPCGRDEPACSAMTINPNRRIPNTGTTPRTKEYCAAPDAAGWPPKTRTPSWPGRAALQQLLLHRDAHPRHLPDLRTRRRTARPRQPHRFSAESAWPAQASPRTTDAQPVTSKARSTGAGNAPAAPCATT